MMSAIESNVMVNPRDESNHSKHAETDLAKELSALKECILRASEINHTKINFLKEELASGRYQILSKQIATKMFADIELA